MCAMVDALSSSSPASVEHNRDAYGFTLRPQHLERYKEYDKIYKEEEGERIQRWDDFLLRRLKFLNFTEDKLSANTSGGEEIFEDGPHFFRQKDTKCDENCDVFAQKEENSTSNRILPWIELCAEKDQVWTHIRPSLQMIEDMLSSCVKGKSNTHSNNINSIDEVRNGGGESEQESEEEFYDMEKYESLPDASSSDDLTVLVNSDDISSKSLFAWNEELECLIRGGVPMTLRGELWQAFVGTRARRSHSNYYRDLLSADAKSDTNTEQYSLREDSDDGLSEDSGYIIEKWKGQIEKDIPRTFPGHPALDENGRNALRRILTAYARHNPSVGYCQAMNFFAGFLLLLMPEENAFWTLVGLMDEYFDGYYSEEMIESQVDQLVFVELVQEKFPKLVSHLDYLGVQVAWVTGPWFLSIFMNMLPWESVLRVWDVLLFERNRVMLFRTALALMELYGPALVAAKDAGDAITLLQSLAGSTFDSSQLVLIACMGYRNVNEGILQEMREKHRPSVMLAIKERLKGLRAFRDSQGLASKLFSFKHDARSMMDTPDSKGTVAGWEGDIVNAVPDIHEQAVWLKVELCRLLDEKRSAILRANELETALMEMVKQDNRQELISKVERLEQEIFELQKSLADKQEKEHKMIQVLMRVEQNQKATEDARRFSEQDATAQRFAAQVLQEKYEAAITSLAEMEKRVVMAESTLEATLQYHSGQTKAQSSPRIEDSIEQSSNQIRVKKETPPTTHSTTKKVGLLQRPFGLGMLDRNKMAKEDESE